MTSTADMVQHPDVSEISDLTEGLLSPSESDRLREHLADCELCQDVRTSLEEIRGLLGAVPGTPRMPTDIAERIDAALAAEALLAAGHPETGNSGSGSMGVSRETSTVPVSAATADPAADRSTAAGGGPVTRPQGRPRGGTGPGRATRLRRRTVVLGAAFGVFATGVAVLSFQLLTSESGDQPVRTHSATTHSAGPDELSEDTLERRVRALLQARPVQRDGGTAMTTEGMPGTAPAEPGPEMGGPGPSVPPCVQQGTGRTVPPIAAERGSYQGTDAYLVVLPAAVDIERVEAFVIDAGCTTAASPAPGKVLLTDSYPRR
ncbi:zf-HC2 domain-containing protein [Streptomyces sp. NPDC006798]|uniref:zf-HC2 domain-containing protein n=1 Tax=Streptomyces sp. NPDC006798 TaxID=3155462 RepID=UPI0033D4717B